jgi:hypothetical protein
MSELWFDRKRDRPDSPIPKGFGAVHALVIGVSSYPHLRDGTDEDQRTTNDPFNLQQLGLTATGAYSFAKWLRGEFEAPAAKLSTIRVLLSPTAGELGNNKDMQADVTSGRIRQALFADVRDEAEQWAKSFGQLPSYRDMSIFYAAGHGVQDLDRVSRVLLEDYSATEAFMENAIDVKELCLAMENVDASSQFYFIDACRPSSDATLNGYSSPHMASRPLLIRKKSSRSHRKPRGAIFSSTASEELAYEANKGGTCFSIGLLECLGRYGAEFQNNKWVVTIASLSRALQERVGLQAQNVGHEQFPQWYPLGVCRYGSPVHSYHTPITIPLTIQLNPPPTNLDITDAWLRTYDSRTTIVHGRLAAHPYHGSVEPGQYLFSLFLRNGKTPPSGVDDGFEVRVNEDCHRLLNW